jgi:hypothetical protein
MAGSELRGGIRVGEGLSNPEEEESQMNGYNLTDCQKDLLRKLVRLAKEDKLHKPIFLDYASGQLGIPLRDGGFLETQGDAVGDLQDLCNADLMGSRVGSSGTLLYNIRQAGYDAVDNDFQGPPPYATAQYNIGAIIHTMRGGNIQAVGVADDAEISQVVNDPALLHSQVETLTERLLDEVKSVLAGNDLIEYEQAVRDLKEQLLTEEPDLSLLKRLTRTLGLLDNIEGTIGLMVRVWPYIYPLLLIAAERWG